MINYNGSIGQYNISLAEILELLNYISSEDREIWYKVGMALHDKYGDAAKESWKTWSGKSSKYNKRNAEATWRSFKTGSGSKITIATIIYWAKEGGWTPEQNNSALISLTNSSTKIISEAKFETAPEVITKDLQEEIRKTSQRAITILENSPLAPDNHPYFISKKIKVNNLKRLKTSILEAPKNSLIVPVYGFDEQQKLQVQGLQFIPPYSEGKKPFLKNTHKKGCFYMIEGEGNEAYLAEGLATAATINMSTNRTAFVSFGKDNLFEAGKNILNMYPDKKLTIVADNDRHLNDLNNGMKKAKEAAEKLGIPMTFMEFPADKIGRNFTDANDFAREFGLEKMEEQLIINSNKIPSTDHVYTDHVDFNELTPLIGSSKEQDFPLDTLPEGIRLAVEEVQKIIKCPISMVVGSALSSLSLAAQGLANVRACKNLPLIPISLYILIVADSGERKTTCDKMFTNSIREWEQEACISKKSEYNKYIAQKDIRDNKLKNLKSKLGKKANEDLKLEEDIEKLQNQEIDIVRIPNLLHDDFTSEKLARNLHNKWPSTGIICSEGGTIFGGYCMRGDSEISSVSMLNQLWSGESKKVDRCNSESFSLINKRITIGVAIQEEIFRAYYDYSKKTAKSSGLIGRFCISYPESTQGFRTKSEIPEDTHYLNAYNKRIKSVLDMPMHINQYGEIQFDTLVLSDDARTVRDNFYEEIEKNLKKYGYWRDVSDFANKSPEIACRFAALFHIYECGVEKKEISELHMKQAVALTEWYLGNTKRFNEIFLLSDPLTKEAVKLADWLFSHCDKIITSAISTRDISRNCPKNIRRSAVRDEILILLEKNGYIKIKQEGKTKIVQINPKFLNKASAYDD